MKILLGTGVLSWDRVERVSDRYGYVFLYVNENSEKQVNLNQTSLTDKIGTLRAKVLEVRDSSHVGDLFRGIYPSTPDVGEIIDLGTGKIDFSDKSYVGLIPEDGRRSDWLDPNMLYRVHNQTVELYFV